MANNVTLPEFFSFKELIYSKYAEDNKISNIPDWPVIANLKYLATCLDEIRRAWKKPIRVTSGFRCDALNKAIGGVDKSHHKLGLAADTRTCTCCFRCYRQCRRYTFYVFSGECGFTGRSVLTCIQQ